MTIPVAFEHQLRLNGRESGPGAVPSGVPAAEARGEGRLRARRAAVGVGGRRGRSRRAGSAAMKPSASRKRAREAAPRRACSLLAAAAARRRPVGGWRIVKATGPSVRKPSESLPLEMTARDGLRARGLPVSMSAKDPVVASRADAGRRREVGVPAGSVATGPAGARRRPRRLVRQLDVELRGRLTVRKAARPRPNAKTFLRPDDAGVRYRGLDVRMPRGGGVLLEPGAPNVSAGPQRGERVGVALRGRGVARGQGRGRSASDGTRGGIAQAGPPAGTSGRGSR